jgi:probable DNA metabolism protein
MSQHTVILAGETDLSGFRREARTLLARLVPPEETYWRTQVDAAADLNTKNGKSATTALRGPHGSQPASNLFLPRSFLSLCDTVILHNDPSRFVLLYRLLWRLVHEPDLRRNPLDADRMRALHMAQAVRRDMQKMKTLIRFKAVDAEVGGEPLHIGWFEPDHHIVEAIAPFFARRLAKMHWAILTPERSIRWNGESLEFGPGVRRMSSPPDQASSDDWLVHYRQVFKADCLEFPFKQETKSSDARTP